MQSLLNRMRHLQASVRWFELALWTLLILAITVRVMKLPLMEFKADEFLFLMRSFQEPFNLERIHDIRSLIPIPHPPMFAYLLALPTSLTVSPLAVTAYIVGLNLLGLWFLYSFCRHVFSRDIALSVTTFVASMPWSVIFSRKIWNPDIVFPCEMLFLLAFVWLLKEYKPWKLYIFAIALSIYMQAHLLLLFSIFLVLFIFWIARLPVHRDHLVRAFLLLFILHLPYLAYAFSADTKEIDLFRQYHVYSAGIDWGVGGTNLLWWLKTSSGLGFSYLLGEGAYETFTNTFLLRFIEIVFTLFAAISVLAYFWCLNGTIASLRKRGRGGLEPYKLVVLYLLLWSLLLFTMLSAGQIESVPHYWVSSLFILPFCTVLFMQAMYRHMQRALQCVVHGFFLLVVTCNIIFMLSFYSFIEKNPEAIDGDYGTPFMFDREMWEGYLESGAAGTLGGV